MTVPIHIWVGRFGKVDQVDHQWVDTEYFMIPTPLFPLESAFCIAETKQKVRRIPIRLHFLSVLLGYVRWYLGLTAAAVTTLAIVFATEGPHPRPWFLFIPACLLLVAFCTSMWYLGRLSEMEKMRRQILGRITGLCADPAILPGKMVAEVLGNLRKAAEVAGLSASPDYWENHVPGPNSLPLLFALATYKKQLDASGRWKRLAEDFWVMLEREAGHSGKAP